MATEHASTTTSNAPPPAAFAFPHDVKASVSYWYRHSGALAAKAAERNLIARGLRDAGLPFSIAKQDSIGELEHVVDEPQGQATATTTKVATLKRVQLGGHKDRFLNVLEIGNKDKTAENDEHAVLVLHGYGNALAFWWRNFAALSEHANTRVYLLDWLGMGFSGRPPFPSIKPTAACSREDDGKVRGGGGGGGGETNEWRATRQRVESAEAFFLDALDELRERDERLRTATKLTLVGHSLGAYLATAYAIRRPELVNKLVLVSPVGVPRAPYDMPSPPPPSSPSSSFNGQAAVAAATNATADALLAHELRDSRDEAEPTATAGRRPPAPRSWWTRLWEANVSPFSVVRASTVLAPKLVSIYAARRFAAFSPETQADAFAYLYQICRARGSGEYALAHILAPGAYARYPLIDRLDGLPGNVPVTFIYGDRDWMDERGGRDVVRSLRERHTARGHGSAQDAQAMYKTLQNPDSGHWVHLDNARSFNALITREITEAVEHWQQQQQQPTRR